LLRSSGVYLPLTYKPDVFSALGIYRNNRWGFRPTIYSSRALVTEGRSRVETVGTGKWFYNSSRGLQFPNEAEKDNIFAGLSVSEVGEGNNKNNNATATVEDPNAEKYNPLQDVKGQVPSSSVALSRLEVATPIREDLSDLPQKTDISRSSKKPVKNESGKAKEKDSAPETESSSKKLVKEENCLNPTNPPALDLNISKELLKEPNKEKVGNSQSRMDKSVESSAAQPAEKNLAMERITAQGVISKVPKTGIEASGVDIEIKDKEYISATKKKAESYKADHHSAPAVTQPRKVQPDWLAKLQELKLRSLDQF